MTTTSCSAGAPARRQRTPRPPADCDRSARGPRDDAGGDLRSCDPHREPPGDAPRHLRRDAVGAQHPPTRVDLPHRRLAAAPSTSEPRHRHPPARPTISTATTPAPRRPAQRPHPGCHRRLRLRTRPPQRPTSTSPDPPATRPGHRSPCRPRQASAAATAATSPERSPRPGGTRAPRPLRRTAITARMRGRFRSPSPRGRAPRAHLDQDRADCVATPGPRCALPTHQRAAAVSPRAAPGYPPTAPDAG